MAVKRSEKRLGDILVGDGFITESQLDQVLDDLRTSDKPLGELVIEKGFATPDDVARALAKQHGLQYISISDYEIDADVIATIGEDIARRYKIIPVDRHENTLTMAVSNPADILLLDDIKIKTRMDVIPLISSAKEIDKAIDKYYGQTQEQMDQLLDQIAGGDDVEVLDTEVSDDIGEVDAEAAPVIKLVNLIVSEAIRTGTSDIHFEPEEKTIRLRYRVDGTLIEQTPPPKKLQNAMISRLKIMSELDIAEKRKPQDGRFKIKSNGKTVDFRVSVMPTVHGEKIVLRLLDKSNLALDMTHLGFAPSQLASFDRAITRPFGMILVTGPTGSGKSTTLYSALSKINDPKKNIITVEDPVEYQIKGINQVQARPDIGFGFAEGLKAILRQDPDIIMIGEIRDKDTGEIGVKAALTGHLVLSTLHTNDAPSAATRLINMGIEPFLVSASVNMVIAQRLARRICSGCRDAYHPAPEVWQELGLDPEEHKETPLYKGLGCPRCNGTGYKGRVALYEVMDMSENLGDMIVKGVPSNILKRAAREEGMLTLRDSGVRKALEGVTTVEEVLTTTFENA